MFKNSKISIAIVAFLFVGFVFTTTSALSYWQEVTVSNNVDIINIGDPVEIVVTDLNSSTESVTLVPNGYAIEVNDVDFVTLTYRVGVSQELLNEVNLIISINTILINDDDTYSHLIDIDILNMGDIATVDLFNDTLTITIVIRLIEPIDADEANELGLDPNRVNVEDSVAAYNAMKGQNISFQLLFELKNKE
ncbi:MAG: hypothetical protein PF513_02420 [Tenericutes bacterium]|jgi:hypothetical protein|nr:hypothetical protein [Mycoplasmatota bacterium]